MNPNVRWGVILGVAVGLMSLLFGLIGWHEVFTMSFVFLAIAILLNIVAVVQSLRAQAATATWLQQVLNGLVLALVASVIIFLSSWLVTSVVFPEYFAEMAEGYRAAFAAMGLPADQVDEMVSATAATSPVRSALDGVIGTMATSVIVAGIAGIWLRKK